MQRWIAKELVDYVPKALAGEFAKQADKGEIEGVVAVCLVFRDGGCRMLCQSAAFALGLVPGAEDTRKVLAVVSADVVEYIRANRKIKGAGHGQGKG